VLAGVLPEPVGGGFPAVVVDEVLTVAAGEARGVLRELRVANSRG